MSSEKFCLAQTARHIPALTSLRMQVYFRPSLLREAKRGNTSGRVCYDYTTQASRNRHTMPISHVTTQKRMWRELWRELW